MISIKIAFHLGDLKLINILKNVKKFFLWFYIEDQKD